MKSLRALWLALPAIFTLPATSSAETVFAQDFESGALGTSESVFGQFSVNNTHPTLGNGTMVVGHSVAYGPLGGGATPLPSYSYYEVVLDLRGWIEVEMSFDLTGGIENAFDGINIVASTDGPVDPPNGLLNPVAASQLQYGAITVHGASSPELGPTAWFSSAASNVESVEGAFDLATFDDQKVILRFQFGTDAFEGGEGVTFDNILVEGTRLPDADGDGMNDGYEDANGLNSNLDDRDLDLDGDGVTNFQEYLNCTDPNDPDSDGDNLLDRVETNTGIFVDADDTGTDPNNPDTDGDTLNDDIEDNSLIFGGLNSPGTNPHSTDTDGDRFGDREEIDLGFDPTDPNNTPPFPVFEIIPALLGSDLTDPENDGIESATVFGPPQTAGTNFNWVGISASNEEYFTPVGGSEGAFDVFDNQIGGGVNKWCCDGAPVDLTVEFEEPVSLTHFTVTCGNDTPTRDPLDWEIQGSNDGVTFEAIFSQSDDTPLWPAERNLTLLVNLPRPSDAFKFIRYSVTRTGGPNHQISEIEYFGTVGTPILFQVTDISYDEDTDMITLTWNSRKGRDYAVFFSPDMLDFGADVNDSVPSGGETTTFTFANPSVDVDRLYFRVTENN